MMTKRILTGLFMALVIAALLPAGGQQEADAAEEGPVTITWWSHWANEPSKRVVIEQIKDEYMAANPDVVIDLVWWDKEPLQQAWRTAMTAGEGAPDIVTDPAGDTMVQLEAGWFLPLGDDFPWDNYKPGAQDNAQYSGFDGYYKYNIGQSINMIFYNKEIFDEIGVDVPDDYTFTQDEWVDIIRRANAAGYAGSALAIGNRPYPALFPIWFSFFSLVGADEFYDYINGLQSWDTPEARQVLDWIAEMGDAGMWPNTFSTMTIDDFHVYWHTQRQAATLWIPSWYTGRAFKPESEGGQDPDWQFGMLRYPRMDGGVAEDRVIGGFESGYMISSATEHPEIARDILAFAAQPRYGALWEVATDIPSAIRYESSDVPADAPESPWGWYHDEINRVYGPLAMDVVELLAPPERSGDFTNATTSVLNEGLPLGLIDVDEAIERMNAAR